MSADKPPLESRLREALHAEAREHPLASDFVTSVAGIPLTIKTPRAGS